MPHRDLPDIVKPKPEPESRLTQLFSWIQLVPAAGMECAANPLSPDGSDISVKDAELLCPELALDPTGPYPTKCANFNQLGIRVPFMAISPFSKPHYVSHVNFDHTSVLAFIEKRFLASGNTPLHLTGRDADANALLDLSDFKHSPSLNTPLTQAFPPTPGNDCTPKTRGTGLP